jgi:hypothetical protein
MYEIQDVAQNIKYIAIGGSLIFVVLISIIIYNMVSIHNLDKNSENDHKKQLLSIALNKHDLNMMKQYVNEEDSSINNKINRNKMSSRINKNLIDRNKRDLTNTLSLLEENKKDLNTMNQQVILNKTKNASSETAFDTYKRNQADTINIIQEKQQTIQSNIGEFKYDDFNVVRDSVNSNNVRINNLNTSMGTLTSDVDDNYMDLERLNSSVEIIDEEMDVMNGIFLRKDALNNELDLFYKDTILPKYTEMNFVMNSNANSINQNMDSIASLEENMGSNLGMIAGLEENMGFNLGRIGYLETDVSTNLGRIVDLEGEMYTSVDNVRSLTSKLGFQDRRYDTHTNDLNKAFKKVRDTYSNMDTRIIGNTSNIQSMGDKMGTMDESIQNNFKIIDGLSSSSLVQEEF